jgi:hypothetical protein
MGAEGGSMSMSSGITGPRRVQVWQADAEWPDDVYVIPAEDHDIVLADRDTKAANLKLLVETALAYKDARDSAVGGPDHIDTYEADRIFDGLVKLARGLKQ